VFSLVCFFASLFLELNFCFNFTLIVFLDPLSHVLCFSCAVRSAHTWDPTCTHMGFVLTVLMMFMLSITTQIGVSQSRVLQLKAACFQLPSFIHSFICPTLSPRLSFYTILTNSLFKILFRQVSLGGLLQSM